jgi:phosphoenolpyruvate synthase/pyruvate phosphate dikinase
MTRVLSLSDPRATDAALSGNKMATLALLQAASVPVLPSFIVTTECGALGDPEVESAITRAYDGLGRDVAVSVRSSATGEDMAHRSGAGMFATVLDVVGVEDLFAAIATCRASAGRNHVRAYLGNGGEAETHMAVGVMTMLVPVISGVTFTRSPLGTGHMVVEVVPGPLGPLVDGTVIPEHVDLRPEDGTVLQRVVGEHGTHVISDLQLAAVRAMCSTISDVLGGDVDVEWAFDEERLVVLQARPVTGKSVFVG